MIDLSRSLVNYLRQDPTLAGLLGDFRGHASVFASSPIPSGAGTPFIVTEAISDDTLPVKEVVAREIVQELGVYGRENDGAAIIETISEYLREKVRVPFDVPDWTVSSLEINGPTPDDVDDYHGRILTLRILLDR